MIGHETCPRCLNMFLGHLAALSRVDNRTHICSTCGTLEALYQFAHPGEPLPPLNVRIVQG